ncbi:hypothetical protein CaCOL14_013310 [Colletotrichum acutatum]
MSVMNRKRRSIVTYQFLCQGWDFRLTCLALTVGECLAARERREVSHALITPIRPVIRNELCKLLNLLH